LSDAVLLTVAAVGAELTREQQPNLPITPEELARDARECEDAGASIYHLHVRDAQGKPTMDVARFEAALDAIRSSSSLIVQFTSGGAVTDTEADRIAPLDLLPDMATLTTGTVNFGDEVFSNPAPLVRRFYERMRSLGIVPEFEIFDSGMVANALSVAGDEPGHHLHFDLVLGVPGAMPAWEDSIGFLTAKLPPGATWSATGIGRSHLPVALQTLERGGHVRTGFEDVRYFAPGELAASNAQLIERVAAMAADAGRSVAAPEDARTLLSLPGRGGTLPA
jgi:3-keto-5-aminohexanoate cleavage enzyme